MKITKYFNRNTLKYDSWTPAYFEILPRLCILYDKNSITQENYHEEIRIYIDWFFISFTFSIFWNNHINLL